MTPKVQDAIEVNELEAWQPIEKLKYGIPVLIYDPAWIDPDFNPKGIREGFRNEDNTGPIWSAKWNDCGDCWETMIDDGGTHWKAQPQPPEGGDRNE